MLGVLKHDYTVIGTTVALGLSDGIPPHHNIRELIPHSKLVKFIVSMRNVFLNEFAQEKEQQEDWLMGIDGEAMFVGTIVHSLEHQMYNDLILDYLWLDHNHKDFGFMAEFGQMTAVWDENKTNAKKALNSGHFIGRVFPLRNLKTGQRRPL